MKTLILGLVLSSIIVTFGLAYGQSGLFEIKGNGAAVINSDNPKLYSSTMKITLSGASTIDKGAILITGKNMMILARFVPNQWQLSYNNDGSFHGEGPAQTSSHEVYSVSLDGTRIFATGDGSMWKVSAIMQNKDRKFVLSYLIIGSDPIPTINVANLEKILIPNGNAAQANTGFFLPLNLEVIRGTTVVWQNEDNIGHTVQSQDAQGNVIPLFNSGLLKTGDTFTYKFDKPGVYHYFCTIHPWRIGIVTVS